PPDSIPDRTRAHASAELVGVSTCLILETSQEVEPNVRRQSRISLRKRSQKLQLTFLFRHGSDDSHGKLCWANAQGLAGGCPVRGCQGMKGLSVDRTVDAVDRNGLSKGCNRTQFFDDRSHLIGEHHDSVGKSSADAPFQTLNAQCITYIEHDSGSGYSG